MQINCSWVKWVTVHIKTCYDLHTFVICFIEQLFYTHIIFLCKWVFTFGNGLQQKIQRRTSSHTKNFDVFVSFRGEDTRNGFTNHLFAALQRKGVLAFRDDQTIDKGEFLECELLQAIEESRVFIVVFSKDYASSTWCLKEFTKMGSTNRSMFASYFL